MNKCVYKTGRPGGRKNRRGEQGGTAIPKPIFLRSFYPEAHAYCVSLLSVGRKLRGRLYTGDLNPWACSQRCFAWVAARTQLRLKSLEKISLSLFFLIYFIDPELIYNVQLIYAIQQSDQLYTEMHSFSFSISLWFITEC